MEQDEQVEELYDFLYKDNNRISSYYAQLFGGRLTTLEHSKSERETGERAGHLSAGGIIGGDLKSTTEAQSASKRVIDPHDIISIDVLAQLREGWKLWGDIPSAPAGSLVLVQGTLSIYDRHFLEAAGPIFDQAIEDEKKKPKKDQTGISGMKVLRGMLEKLRMPTAYLLQTKTDHSIAGTIKEEGLDEPSSAFYFKHGDEGAQDVYLIGIKDKPSSKQNVQMTDLINVSKNLAIILNQMLFPSGAIRVTPIAMFRRLTKTPSKSKKAPGTESPESPEK